MKQTLLLAIAVIALAACDSAETEYRVVGELASDRIELSAEFNERIVEITVAEGESVSRGQLLIQQDDAKANARLAEATAVYLQAKARMDELVRGPRSEKITAARANVEGATQDFEFRQSELKRITEIHLRGLSSPDSLDRANAADDAAQAILKRRLSELEELLAGTTIEELAQAEQRIRQAEAKQDAAQIDVDHHAFFAPVDSIVDSRLFEIGERPGVGQPTMILLGGIQPYARVYVPEQIRVKIKTGTKATIYVDGLDSPVAGEVRWVASEAAYTPYFALTERDRGRLSYIAKVDVAEDRDRLPDGVPVEVEFQFN